MTYSPQDTARAMIQWLRAAHTTSNQLANSSGNLNVRLVRDQVETICQAMISADNALSTLQTAFDNATIASRISNHLEPAPADLPAAYTAARAAWQTMADDYGTNVLGNMGGSWTWDAVNRKHVDAVYDIDSTANFRTNLAALRDALAVFA